MGGRRRRDVVQRQQTIDNKVAVSQAYSDASQATGGTILNVAAVNDPAFLAATRVIQHVTFDPTTVTTAIMGIDNAVAQHNLALII